MICLHLPLLPVLMLAWRVLLPKRKLTFKLLDIKTPLHFQFLMILMLVLIEHWQVQSLKYWTVTKFVAPKPNHHKKSPSLWCCSEAPLIDVVSTTVGQGVDDAETTSSMGTATALAAMATGEDELFDRVADMIKDLLAIILSNNSWSFPYYATGLTAGQKKLNRISFSFFPYSKKIVLLLLVLHSCSLQRFWWCEAIPALSVSPTTYKGW